MLASEGAQQQSTMSSCPDHVVYVGGDDGPLVLDVHEPATEEMGLVDLDALAVPAVTASVVAFGEWAPRAMRAALDAVGAHGDLAGFVKLWSNAIELDARALASACHEHERSIQSGASSLQYLVEMSSRERARAIAAGAAAVRGEMQEWRARLRQVFEKWASAAMQLAGACRALADAHALARKQLQAAREDLRAQVARATELDETWRTRCAELVDEEFARFAGEADGVREAAEVRLRKLARESFVVDGAFVPPASRAVEALHSPQLSEYARACMAHLELQALVSMLEVVDRLGDVLCMSSPT